MLRDGALWLQGTLTSTGLSGWSWLEGVDPDTSRSRYPEKVYFWKRVSQNMDAKRKVAMYRRLRRSGHAE